MDINRRVVYHSIIETGGGYEDLTFFSSIMNVPCISKPVYYQHVETILDAFELDAQENMKTAGQKSDLQARRKENKQNKQNSGDKRIDRRLYGMQRVSPMNLEPSNLPLLNLHCCIWSNYGLLSP